MPSALNDLLEQARSFDNKPAWPANRRKKLELLRKARALAPDDVETNYMLAWSLTNGDADDVATVESCCAKIAELTKRIPIESAKEPSVEARARAFALAWALPKRISTSATVGDAEKLLARATEAYTLRRTWLQEQAKTGAEATLAFARARAQNEMDRAYAWLLDWVEHHPSHSYYPFRESPETKGVSAAESLAPFFEDTGFVAWVRQQKPTKSIKPKEAERAVAFAAGFDLMQARAKEPEAFGRLGRLLALKALGATRARIESVFWGDPFGTVEIMATAAPWMLGSLGELGLSIDEGLDGVPPLIGVMRHPDAVRALLRAGANPSAKDPKGRTALDVAREGKLAKVLKLLGASKVKGSLDIKPVQAALEDIPKRVGNVKAVRAFLSSVATCGFKNWSEAASMVDRLDPDARLVLALALRVVPAGPRVKATTLRSEKPTIVLGDLEVDGEIAVSGEWIVTGSVACDCYVDGEATSMSIGGDLDARYVYSEGQLWTAGNLNAKLVWADLQSGDLVVKQTLKTDVLVAIDRPISTGKTAARTICKKTGDTKKAFPTEAFEGDALSPSKVYKLVKAKKLA